MLLVIEMVLREQYVAKAEDAIERRSQLMADRGEEIALQAVRFVKSHVRAGKLIDFMVQVRVDLPPAVLHAHQVSQHPVERVAQILELVARLDLATHIQLAGSDGVTDLLEMLHGFDDDIANNEVTAGHDQDG